jgi:hypothetical protein
VHGSNLNTQFFSVGISGFPSVFQGDCNFSQFVSTSSFYNMQLKEDTKCWHNGKILAWLLSLFGYLQNLGFYVKKVTLTQNAYLLFLNIVSKITAKIYVQQVMFLAHKQRRTCVSM